MTHRVDPMTTSLRERRGTAALACAAAVGLLSACRDPDAAAGSGSAAETVRRYTVRGEVVQPPAAGRSPAQLTVRHEAIPDFVDRSGQRVGMAPMTMALDLAPGAAASARDLRAGDKVELVLAVDWTRPMSRIESVRRLPGGAVLQVGGGR
jgi:Cu/Ag efflux protein CusF